MYNYIKVTFYKVLLGMKISTIFQTKAIWQSLISCIVTNLSWIMAFCVTGTLYQCYFDLLTFYVTGVTGTVPASSGKLLDLVWVTGAPSSPKYPWQKTNLRIHPRKDYTSLLRNFWSTTNQRNGYRYIGLVKDTQFDFIGFLLLCIKKFHHSIVSMGFRCCKSIW